jgi:hypothetical protein
MASRAARIWRRIWLLPRANFRGVCSPWPRVAARSSGAV